MFTLGLIPTLYNLEEIYIPLSNFITSFLATLAAFNLQGLTTEVKACK